MQVQSPENIYWHGVLRDARTPISLVGLDGRVLRASPGLVRLLGYREAELREMERRSLMHPDDVDRDLRALRALIDGHEPACRLDKRYIRRDETVLRAASTMFLIRDASGRPEFAVEVIDMVGGQGQEPLEDRLRTLVDSIPAYVSEIDSGRRYVMVNRAYEEAYGRNRAELEGRTVAEVLGEDSYRTIAPKIDRVFTGEAVAFEEWLPVGGRGMRLHRISYLPKRGADGRVDGLFVFAVDDTERAAAEEGRRVALARLSEKTQMLDAVLAAAADSIIMLDRDGRCLYASRPIARGFGMVRAEMLDRTVWDFGLPESVAARIDRTRLQVMTSGEPVMAEVDLPTPRGLRHYDYTMRPVKDANGAVLAVVVTARDMTQRQRVEDGMRRALAEKEALLLELQHRVKNNMQIVVSLLNLQSQGITQPELKRRHDELGNRIRALALVHEMLTDSRSMAGIDLADYIVRLCGQLQSFHQDGRRPVELRFRLDPVIADMDRAVPLGLIVNELVSNTLVHAFPPGSRGTADIGLAAADGYVELSVADDGVGFGGPPPPGGAGLGTRLIQALAAQIGGELRYDPNADGTRAVVRWPAG